MASHGISVGEVSMDVSKMMETKNAKVDGLTGGIEYLCKKYKVRTAACGLSTASPAAIYFFMSLAYTTVHARQPLNIYRFVISLRWTTSRASASLVDRTQLMLI